MSCFLFTLFSFFKAVGSKITKKLISNRKISLNYVESFRNCQTGYYEIFLASWKVSAVGLKNYSISLLMIKTYIISIQLQISCTLPFNVTLIRMALKVIWIPKCNNTENNLFFRGMHCRKRRKRKGQRKTMW